MKIFAALALVASLVATPVEVKVEAAGIPWSTFSSSKDDVVQATMGSCAVNGQQKEVLFVAFEKNGVTWLYFAEPEGGRWVFAEMGGDGKPVRIYTGKQLPEPDHDKIVVRESHAFNEVRDGGGPCKELFPDQA